MKIQAQIKLNPLNYYLSKDAEKRLKWMYIIHYECEGNITKASNKIGVSRRWLSPIHSKWEKDERDPHSLEPESRAPKRVDNRKKIDKTIENKIIEIRKKHHWGKDKLAVVLERDHKMKVGATTVNRYLDKHGLINVKISNKNKLAHKNNKKINELIGVEKKQKCRPPKEIKDYKPGALIEKDMKFILKMGKFANYEKHKAKENFWLQHTILDSFTRIRVIEVAEDGDSGTAAKLHKKAVSRLPFNIACENTDNGSENMGKFEEHLEKENIVHFYSRAGMPTDNPRVERSHLTDEVEFYKHGGIKNSFIEQKEAITNHEYIYNHVRPHQALAYKTPMEFYELWKINPNKAYEIVDKWQAYLKKNSKRLATSRRMKKKEKIEKLMKQIDIKLKSNNCQKCQI